MHFNQFLYTQAKPKSIFETTQSEVPIEKIKKEIEENVGEAADDSQKLAANESLKKALDLLPLEYSQNPQNAGLEDIFKLLSQKSRLGIIESFVEQESKTLEELTKEIEKLKVTEEEVKYISYVKTYSTICERLSKLYHIFSEVGGIKEEVNEDSDLDPETAQKIKNLLAQIKKALTTFKKVLDIEKNRINLTPNTAEGEEQLIYYKKLIDFLGLSDFVKAEYQKKLKNVSQATGARGNVKKKLRILNNRLVKAIQFGQLPVTSDGVIKTNGDLYQLFKALEEQNKAWMDLSLSKYVLNASPTRLAEFNANARDKESAAEEDQLTYLMASRSWILSYIESNVDGVLDKKEDAAVKSKLQTATDSKEKEIKNYYLSKDFNLGNFGGIQIKPKIALPLYTKVKLAVSKEDRIKESPLRNLLKGIGQIVSGLFSAIPDQSNPEILRKSLARNKFIFGGINAIIKAGVITIGGKEAGRKYDKGLEKLTGSADKQRIREQAMPAASGTPPGQLMQTPTGLAGSMDTFSLLGPGKKAPKKKKKTVKQPAVSNRVASFADFVKGK